MNYETLSPQNLYRFIFHLNLFYGLINFQILKKLFHLNFIKPVNFLISFQVIEQFEAPDSLILSIGFVVIKEL